MECSMIPASEPAIMWALTDTLAGRLSYTSSSGSCSAPAPGGAGPHAPAASSAREARAGCARTQPSSMSLREGGRSGSRARRGKQLHDHSAKPTLPPPVNSLPPPGITPVYSLPLPYTGQRDRRPTLPRAFDDWGARPIGVRGGSEGWQDGPMAPRVPPPQAKRRPLPVTNRHGAREVGGAAVMWAGIGPTTCGKGQGPQPKGRGLGRAGEATCVEGDGVLS
ncbi:hypothetical protein chiPu_0024472 [Chiloscyllium punctatum]|uniref:Uncharacterized protein n=1 Tax=Chiloscyllium punctatum TaxID=137246 RepID=A0A401TDJ2_CHIPU|nr:hypothetical protein [Chiloscyllium punctatum]